MRLVFLAALAVPIAACSGSTSQDLLDAGNDTPGYSTHTHSDDAGAHVHGDPTGLTASHSHGLELLPDGRVLWATHQGVFTLDPADGVPNAVVDGPDFHALVANPHRADHLWASGTWPEEGHDRWGLVESTNGGADWSSVAHDGDLVFEVLAASAETDGFIAGVADGAVWYSRDSGETWDSFDWPGDCTGLIVTETETPRFMLSGAWGIIEVGAGEEDRTTRFSGPVTDLGLWSGGTTYAIAGSLVACGQDIQDVGGCVALNPPSTHPVRQIIDDPARDTWYVLTSGPELYSRVGDAHWQRIATGL